jgi:hypothetical protein
MNCWVFQLVWLCIALSVPYYQWRQKTLLSQLSVHFIHSCTKCLVQFSTLRQCLLNPFYYVDVTGNNCFLSAHYYVSAKLVISPVSFSVENNNWAEFVIFAMIFFSAFVVIWERKRSKNSAMAVLTALPLVGLLWSVSSMYELSFLLAYLSVLVINTVHVRHK